MLEQRKSPHASVQKSFLAKWLHSHAVQLRASHGVPECYSWGFGRAWKQQCRHSIVWAPASDVVLALNGMCCHIANKSSILLTFTNLLAAARFHIAEDSIGSFFPYSGVVSGPHCCFSLSHKEVYAILSGSHPGLFLSYPAQLFRRFIMYQVPLFNHVCTCVLCSSVVDGTPHSGQRHDHSKEI